MVAERGFSACTDYAPVPAGLFKSLPTQRVLKDYQVGEFYPRQAEMLRMKEEACKASAQTFPLCVRMLYKPFGLRPSQYDVTKLEYLLKSFGSGTSTKVIEHIMQIIQTGWLQQFDYGPQKNLLMYGSHKPPEYDISNTTCPVVLHYDKNDYLVDYKAVELAAKKLPCLFCDCMGNREGFSHFGYVISSYASQYVFRKVVRSMRLLETEVGRDLACS
ncbi:hypothetical protein J6590_047280 [Homalodisca vitripennis]|nr:hypothetical protein J6590_047280 [Homalodisca vitripennis]